MPLVNAPRARTAPAAIVIPTSTNEAFMTACHGEQTTTEEAFGYGPHAVLPRSLM